MGIICAIDPGKVKCGIVFYDLENEKIIYKAIVRLEELYSICLEKRNEIESIILGNGTNSKEIFKRLEKIGFKNILFCCEENTSAVVRKRLCRSLKGLMKVLFSDYDDEVAEEILKRFLIGPTINKD